MKKISVLFLFIISLILLPACDKNSDVEPLALGDPDAPVLIEEFSDIQCPACGLISPQVEVLARKNSDIVRLEFYHFPLSYHEFAFTGAMATECARDQGKGWEYLGSLFAKQKSVNDAYFYNLALALNMDMDEFKECLDGDKKRAKVASDLAEGKKRSLPGTPTLFINGKQVNWSSYEIMEQYIKALAE